MKETDTFRGHYSSVLHPYQIGMANSAIAVATQE